MKNLKKQAELRAARAGEGDRLKQEKLSNVRETLDKFKVSLEEFASKHKARINADPEFRDQFHRLCKSAKVDPLASGKGFWTDILGLGDFYIELGVIIVEKCLQTRSSNGGMILLSDLVKLVRSHSSGRQSTSEDDVLQALEKLKVLGNGFRLLCIGGTRFVLSVPMEINNDCQELMAVAQKLQSRGHYDDSDSSSSSSSSSGGGGGGGGVSEGIMTPAPYSWSPERFQLVLAPLLREGLVWVDIHHNQEDSYYFPSVSL